MIPSLLFAFSMQDPPPARLEQRGFVENRTVIYSQTAPNDDAHAVSEMLVRWEASYKFASWFSVSGAFDARTDTHRQAAREWKFTADDRTIQRPPFSLRRLSATVHRGKFTGAIGRQLVRWGKADIL